MKEKIYLVVKHLFSVVLLFFILAFLLFSAFLGAVVGFKIGLSIDFPSSESKPWDLISGTVKFSKIMDASVDRVWAQSADGKLYSWAYYCNGMNCKQWIETLNVPDDAHQNDVQPMSRSLICPQKNEYPKTGPPGKVVECITNTEHNGSGYSRMYYVLLEDGTIWRWSPYVLNDVPFFFGVCWHTCRLFVWRICWRPFNILSHEKKEMAVSAILTISLFSKGYNPLIVYISARQWIYFCSFGGAGSHPSC